jgi:hypothetical protein
MTPRATLFALGAVTTAALGACNVFPVVFDEVTVKAVDQVVDGPHRPVAGAIVVRELHMDGETEDKIFAPGYGEFSTGSGANVEALALAVPTDALPGPTRFGSCSPEPAACSAMPNQRTGVTRREPSAP